MAFDKNHYLMTCYYGRKLLQEHKLVETGTWTVYGEDPNCDFGGYHHEPKLGIFEGSLDEVVVKAVDLPGFWAWGSGGRIEKAQIIHAAKPKENKPVKAFDKISISLELSKEEILELVNEAIKKEFPGKKIDKPQFLLHDVANDPRDQSAHQWEFKSLKVNLVKE